MIRCACDLSFKDADFHLLHQASMGLAATFELIDRAKALGRDGVPMSELAEAALDSNARHRALVPGIDYGEKTMPDARAMVPCGRCKKTFLVEVMTDWGAYFACKSCDERMVAEAHGGPVEAPKPDPFDPCQLCMHNRRAHDSGGCGKWLERSPSHGPHDGKLCYCTKFVEAVPLDL